MSINYKKIIRNYVHNEIKKSYILCQTKKQQEVFTNLLNHTRKYSLLLKPCARGGEYLHYSSIEIVRALFAVTNHHTTWIQPIESWNPSSQNKYTQFFSLVNHLFAKYPVPFFMTAVWFKNHSSEANRQQNWFKHIGSGKNIRTANIPLVFSKKMAHHFLKAPSHLTVESAFRWGQILGFGGSEILAKNIIQSKLANKFYNENFWEKVLLFFVKHPNLPQEQICPIIDYLNQIKFIPHTICGVVQETSAEPHFSMKGQTLSSIMRRMEIWHKLLARYGGEKKTWPKSGINNFTFVEKSNSEKIEYWSIEELLDSHALFIEGRKMQHCVASYQWKCVSGNASIWSMTLEKDKKIHKILTIEVDKKKKQICQVRMKKNKFADEKTMKILKLWASKERLLLKNLS